MKTSGNLRGLDRTRRSVEPRRRFGLPCAVAGVWLVLVPCESGTNPGGEGTVHRDSAGVTVAETRAPLWTEGDGWTVRGPAVVEIGGTGPGAGVHFGEVAGVVRLRRRPRRVPRH